MADALRPLEEAPRAPIISGPPPDVTGDELAEVRVLDRVPRLVQRAKRGDRDAFGELYRSFHGPIFRMVRYRLFGDGAEDAVAETFTRAWSALPGYRDTGAPFVTWLYGIARHVVMDELSRRKRVEPRGELPEAIAEWAQDDRLALAEALSKLPREQRQVIELKFLLGLTNDEVAAALGKSPGAVNAQQWRALRALRGLLEAR